MQWSIVQIEHLVRIEDVERVERALDRAHRAQRARAVLPFEVRLLADADAVLAGAGAAARDGALEKTVVDGVPVGRWSGRSQTTIGESAWGLARGPRARGGIRGAEHRPIGRVQRAPPRLRMHATFRRPCGGLV